MVYLQWNLCNLKLGQGTSEKNLSKIQVIEKLQKLRLNKKTTTVANKEFFNMYSKTKDGEQNTCKLYTGYSINKKKVLSGLTKINPKNFFKR